MSIMLMQAFSGNGLDPVGCTVVRRLAWICAIFTKIVPGNRKREGSVSA